MHLNSMKKERKENVFHHYHTSYQKNKDNPTNETHIFGPSIKLQVIYLVLPKINKNNSNRLL